MSISTPPDFVSDLPMKIFTHGFSDSVMRDEKTLFVDGECVKKFNDLN